ALATSLAAFVNVALLYMRLQKTYGCLIDGHNVRRIGAAALSSLIMLAALYLLASLWAFPSAGKLMQAAWVGAAVLGGIIVYFCCALGFGERHLFSRTANIVEKGE
ncbi:MAG: polysaccharide biosynthesis C-terminal domain-containing protein, partial [Mariprofundaceae bacterium]